MLDKLPRPGKKNKERSQNSNKIKNTVLVIPDLSLETKILRLEEKVGEIKGTQESLLTSLIAVSFICGLLVGSIFL